jgi:cyclophilin family peptidyl-prolyl cis-trans isomerase
LPKPRRKTQQHLRQTPARRRSYTVGGQGTGEQYKPPFPMSLLQNQKLFWIVGGVVMILAFFVAAFGSSCNPNRNTTAATPIPTVTPSGSATPDASAAAAASATPNPRKFAQADQVTDPATKTYTATIKTSMGDIVMQLLADKAPKTVNTFVFLAQKGFYDGLQFQRVVPDFVIQGGDGGSGTPAFTTEEDQNDLKNTLGMVSMAKAGAVTNFTSQFFINLKDNPALDQDAPNQKRFYPFAQVTTGMDVVDAIGKVQTDAQNKPTQPVMIQSITITESPK